MAQNEGFGLFFLFPKKKSDFLFREVSKKWCEVGCDEGKREMAKNRGFQG